MRIKDAVNAWSIQKKLILLVVISFLPAVVIIFVTGMREREHEIELGRNRALLMAQSLAAQQEQIAAGTRQMLSTLAQLPDVQRRDAVACRRLFQDLVKQNEIYSVIVAATPDGRLLASSTPLTAGSVRISDRKYFRDALRTKDFSAGEYVMGRVSGVPVINYGYPVLDENENIVTVVVAGFKLYKYDNFIIMEEVNGWRLENIQNVSSCIITLCRFLRQARHLPDFMPGESGSVKLRPLNGRMIFMIPSFFC